MQFFEITGSNLGIEHFISQRKHRNIFQSFELYDVYKASRNHYPFCYALEKDDGQLTAIIFGVTTKYFKKPLSYLTSRAIISGGPLLASGDPEILDFVLKSLKKELGRKNILIQFRNLWNWGNLKDVFEVNGFKYQPHSDILIKLNRPADELIEDINKNKRRNVTKTLNKGTLVRIISDVEDFKCCIRLIRKTYQRILLPFPDESLFFEALKQLSEKGILKVFVAESKTGIIGARMELLFGDTIYDWYAGSDPDFNNLYPNDLLIFHILNWGNANYNLFDFGGAGNPNVPYSVRDYKLNFGGEMVENGRFELVSKKFLFASFNSAYKLNKKVKLWFRQQRPR